MKKIQLESFLYRATQRALKKSRLCNKNIYIRLEDARITDPTMHCRQEYVQCKASGASWAMAAAGVSLCAQAVGSHGAGGVGALWVVFYLSLPAGGGAGGISAGAAQQGP